MSEILNSAIVKVQNAKYAFFRFITANMLNLIFKRREL